MILPKNEELMQLEIFSGLEKWTNLRAFGAKGISRQLSSYLQSEWHGENPETAEETSLTFLSTTWCIPRK
jgi:hypothetical protein